MRLTPKGFAGLCVFLVIYLMAYRAANAEEMIIAVPDQMSKADAAPLMNTLMRFAAENTDPGETSVFINAHTQNRLCQITVPPKKAYSNLKAKLQYNAKCLKTLMAYRDGQQAEGTSPNGKIKLPQLLRSIAQNYQTDQFDSLIIIGSPLYDGGSEPVYSMEYGHIPSDGHIVAGLAASPFAAGRASSLADMKVHILFPDETWQRNDTHAFLVKRFWSLFVAGLGGELVTFDSDLTQGLSRVLQNAPLTAPQYRLASSPKLEMIPVRLKVGSQIPIYDRELSTAPLSPAELASAQNIEIGIRWDCDCDVDLYVQPYQGAEVLYFGKTRTAEGHFFKDYRRAVDLLNGLETVEMSEPVDLRKLLVGINFYSGTAPDGVSGEVRLSVGNRTYAAPFKIAASAGNGSTGGDHFINQRQVPNAHWHKVNVRALVTPQ